MKNTQMDILNEHTLKQGLNAISTCDTDMKMILEKVGTTQER